MPASASNPTSGSSPNSGRPTPGRILWYSPSIRAGSVGAITRTSPSGTAAASVSASAVGTVPISAAGVGCDNQIGIAVAGHVADCHSHAAAERGVVGEELSLHDLRGRVDHADQGWRIGVRGDHDRGAGKVGRVEPVFKLFGRQAERT